MPAKKMDAGASPCIFVQSAKSERRQAGDSLSVHFRVMGAMVHED
jgi:hypothetical protein